MGFELRPYQKEAVEAVQAYWGRGGQNPLVVVPTGGGKSAILGTICRWLVEQHKARVLVATHRKELIQQDADAVRRVWPAADVGIYSAGLNQKQIRTITVGGVQSLYRKPGVLGRVDVVIIDEAHLVSPRSNTQYGKLLEGLRDANPALRVCGLTATPYRLGQGMLTQGAEALFSSVVYNVGIKQLISDGYLSPLVPGTATAAIKLDAVKVVSGEYVAKDLELAADVDSITDAVVRDVLDSRRQHCLVFGCGVQHAAHLRNALRMAGMSAEMVTGQTPPGERARILDRFKAGQIRALVNCDVLTTGFDAPLVDALFVVRATCSPGLWVQIVGRGSRLAPGKRDCLVYDYGGNTARHGPVDEIRIKTGATEGRGKVPTKICPQCYAEVHALKRACQHCDHTFPPPEKQARKANAEASALDVVSSDSQVIEIEERKFCEYFSARSEKNMLRVDYFVPNVIRAVASEYICLEHDSGSYARQQAEKWWAIQSRGRVAPSTVEEAMGKVDTLRRCRTIRLQQQGKYSRVIGWGFEKDDTEDDVPF